MLPVFLLPETTIREAGTGPVIDIGSRASGLILLTLGITRIIEQESLDISIWGSADGSDFGTKPLVSFPQKFYCGTYQVLLDLSQRPEVKQLRVKYHCQRWGKGDPKPLFGAYVFAQEMASQLVAAGAA